MKDARSGGRSNWRIVFSLFFLCSVLLLSDRLTAQTSQPPASSAVVMVEIQCKPGAADQWREAFEKDVVPAIREAIQKGDTFTNFSYLEAPIPAQEIDFVLLFEAKSFGSLDARRIPPHYEVLLRRLGPERFAGLMKEMGNWEKTVRVSLLRSYKVQ
jgi:hypothetical protein